MSHTEKDPINKRIHPNIEKFSFTTKINIFLSGIYIRRLAETQLGFKNQIGTKQLATLVSKF